MTGMLSRWGLCVHYAVTTPRRIRRDRSAVGGSDLVAGNAGAAQDKMSMTILVSQSNGGIMVPGITIWDD